MTNDVEMRNGVGPLALLAFVAEMGMLVGLGVVGWAIGGSWVVSAVLALLLPALLAVVWGRWCAPRAAHRLSRGPRGVLKLVLVTTASVLLLAVGPRPEGWVLAVVTWVLLVVSLPADRD